MFSTNSEKTYCSFAESKMFQKSSITAKLAAAVAIATVFN